MVLGNRGAQHREQCHDVRFNLHIRRNRLAGHVVQAAIIHAEQAFHRAIDDKFCIPDGLAGQHQNVGVKEPGQQFVDHQIEFVRGAQLIKHKPVFDIQIKGNRDLQFGAETHRQTFDPRFGRHLGPASGNRLLQRDGFAVVGGGLVDELHGTLK